MSQTDNSRIAKNTIYLYLRMFIMMFISLFTSRIILQVLGVEDYGISNVVGGLVSMFSLVTGSLSASISRYITFELGKGDINKLKKIFSTSITIQLFLSIIIIILIEIIGVWFLNNKMEIPHERLYAANWVLQLSTISFLINLISLPYNAAIVAHEKMSAFAYLSILDAVFKLSNVFLLYILPFDKLISLSFLGVITGLIMRYIYVRYCLRNFSECHYKFCFDKELIKKMSSFAGWNFYGAASGLLSTQGVNMVMNIFFGVIVNAARGVATSVDMAVNQFVGNFMTSVNPQITKSYASGDYNRVYELIFKSAKFGYFLMLVLFIPLVIETPTFLSLWLGKYPNYSVSFVRWSLSISLLYVLSQPMVVAMLATGNIKKYQILVGGAGLMILPITYILYIMGLDPWYAYLTQFIIYVIQTILRLYLLKDMIGLPSLIFLKDVIFRTFIVTFICLSIPSILSSFFSPSFIRLICISLISVIFTLAIEYYIGTDLLEKKFILEKVKRLRQKFF